MNVSSRLTASVVALLGFTAAANAQIYPITPGYGQNQTIVLQLRNGPFGTLTLASSTRTHLPPGYAPIPPWASPIPIYIPVYLPPPVQSKPQIVIQNVVGPAADAPAPGKAAFPNEFDANLKPAAKNGKGPAVKAPRAVAAASEPAPRKVPGQGDADRALEAGRIAFADGKFGKAIELFQRSREINPKEPSTYFLIAQAYFATAKYREAVAVLAEGIALRADWADARYASRELYTKDAGLFDEHMKTLEQAVVAFPGDVLLAFLLGHQKWFDGKRDDAVLYLAKARELDKDFLPLLAFRIDRR